MNTNAAKYIEIKKMCRNNSIKKINQKLINEKIKNLVPKDLINSLEIKAYGKEEPFAVFMIEIISTKNPEEIFKGREKDLKDIIINLSREFVIDANKIFCLFKVTTEKISCKFNGPKITSANVSEDDIKEFKIEDETPLKDFDIIEKSDLYEKVCRECSDKDLNSFETAIKDLTMRVDEEDLCDYVKEKILEKLTEALFWYESDK